MPLRHWNETGAPTRRPQGEVLRERYAEITAMDRTIGILCKNLTETGIREKKGETSIELFDLKADPAEKTNLIDQQPELLMLNLLYSRKPRSGVADR